MRKIKKTVIMAGYNCNNQCGFCYNSHKRNLPDRAIGEIFKDIVAAKKRGTTYLEIIGGEETIRNDIVDIVKFAKDLGFKIIAMATNGRMFSYRTFAKKIIAAGLNHLIFSIHGHNPQLHDSLTQVDESFSQMLEGFNNAREFGVDKIGSNTTIVRQNYKVLFEIGSFLYDLGIRNAEFIFVDPTRGGAYEYFDEFVPRISEAAPFIRQCLDIGKERKFEHWHIRYVPLCYFLDYEDQVSELHERKIFNTEHRAPDFKNSDVENSRRQIGRIKPSGCAGCIKYDICEGLWKEYYRQYGDGEVKPVKDF